MLFVCQLTTEDTKKLCSSLGSQGKRVLLCGIHGWLVAPALKKPWGATYWHGVR